MNLLQALKSNKPFRRISQGWFFHSPAVFFACLADSKADEIRDDLLAEDWEVEEPKVTVTKNQLAAAILDYIATQERGATFFAGHTVYPDPVAFIAGRLGLEP